MVGGISRVRVRVRVSRVSGMVRVRVGIK